jgi:ribosome-associated protein
LFASRPESRQRRGLSTFMQVLAVNSRLKIPLEELQVRSARSSGPGGQNVNKVNSKITVRWPVRANPRLPDDIRATLVERLGKRLTGKGELLITSQRFRDASRNLADCLAKLRTLVAGALSPRKVRRATRPSRSSVARRLGTKRLKHLKKESRRGERWS